MSVLTLEQTRKNRYIDLLFASFAVALLLLVLVPPAGNVYGSLYNMPQAIDNIHVSLPIHETNKNISFATDQGYWNANCSQGWSADTRCDAIVVRSHSCSISLASAYCSQYESYLQE